MTAPTVHRKNVAFKIKAVGEPDGMENGSFRGYASVFDNRDSAGDVVRKGAFADTLDEWSQGEQNIPLYYGHRLDDPMMNIGQLTSAVEDDHGLLVEGQIDLDNPTGAQTYKLIKGRRLSGMSYSYAVTDGSLVAAAAKDDSGDGEDGDEVFEIRSAKLYEVSVVPVGANPLAEITDVKAALVAVKSGRVISAANLDALRSCQDILSTVIKAAESSSSSDTGKASASGPVKVEEPVRAKAEEPSRGASVTRVADETPLSSPDAALSALAFLDVERLVRT